MAARQDYVVCWEEHKDQTKIIRSSRPHLTKLNLNCLIHPQFHKRFTVNWGLPDKFRLVSHTYPCGHDVSMQEVYPKTSNARNSIAQIRVTGDVTVTCERHDTDAIFSGEVLGKTITFRTNENGYWRQQEHVYKQIKADVFFNRQVSVPGKSKEKFTKYDVDNSDSDTSSVHGAASDDDYYDGEGSSYGAVFEDQTAENNGAVYPNFVWSDLLNKEPPIGSYSPDANLPPVDDVTEFVVDHDFVTGGVPMVNGVGLTIRPVA